MKYDYLINQPRPASTRSKMSAVDRAAQFSSFAALIGLDEQLDETARLVDGKIELSEDEAAVLNGKFQILAQVLNEGGERPQIKVCYFVPDERKDGGAYVTKIGAADFSRLALHYKEKRLKIGNTPLLFLSNTV